MSIESVVLQGNNQGVNIVLRNFKTSTGGLDFQKILSVPREERMPVLNKKDPEHLSVVVTAGLTLALETMNLKRPMSAGQICDLAETIIDSSNEDHLSVEDLMLFLQKFVRGEYGSNYEAMDIPKFMEKFEMYREERWQQLNALRDGVHIQNKTTGDTGRENQESELGAHFSGMAEKFSILNSELKNQRSVNRELQDENYQLKKNIPKD